MEYPSDEVLRKFMIENYGEEWADNLALARLLWKKKFGKKNVYNVNGGFTKEYKDVEKFSDIGDIGRYRIQCVVIDVKKRTYLGCPICKRKQCDHLKQQGVQPVELFLLDMEVADKFGDVKEVLFICPVGELQDEFDSGDVIQMEFFFKNGKIYVDGVKVVKRVKIENIQEDVVEEKNNESESVDEGKLKELLKLLQNLGKLNKLAFERMVKDWGLDMGVVQKYVMLDEAGRYMLNPEGEKLLE
jgi:hypothetical protein